MRLVDIKRLYHKQLWCKQGKKQNMLKLHKRTNKNKKKFVKNYFDFFSAKTCNFSLFSVSLKGCDMTYDEAGGCRLWAGFSVENVRFKKPGD